MYLTVLAILFCINIHYEIGQADEVNCDSGHKACVDGHCCCSQRTATCDGEKNSPLSYLPRFPRQMDKIRMYNQFLPELTRSTFTNISDTVIKLLGIVNARVINISKDAFTDLKYLAELDLSLNREIDKRQLALSFGSINIQQFRTVRLDDIGISGKYPPYLLLELKNSNVYRISLVNNYITSISMADFKHLPILKRLYLMNNSISKFDAVVGHPKLESLDLSQNAIGRHPPSFCSNTAQFPNLKFLYMDRNYISELLPEKWKCLTKLSSLSLSWNAMRKIPNNIFADLASLTKLQMEDVLVLHGRASSIEPYSFNSSSLRKLNLASNGIIFTKVDVKNDIFGSCKNIIYLDISTNKLNYLEDNEIVQLFAPLKKLERLRMVRTRIGKVPNNFLKSFPNLRSLNVDSNSIEDLGDAFLGPNILTTLTVRNNDIKVLKPMSFPQNLRQSLQNLALDHNPFTCSCVNLWFRTWIGELGKPTGTNISLFNWPTGYKCASPTKWSRKLFILFRPTSKSCQKDNILLITFAILGPLIFVGFVSIPVCIRYRWYVQYIIFKLGRSNGNRTNSISGNEMGRQQFQPYAYVIYHDDDRDFVHNVLRSLLEDDIGLKLYIWHREADIGSKASVMFDAIHSSSHVLAVISNSFVNDGWCNFQLNIGLWKKNEAMEDCLTLLLLDDLDISLLRKSWCVTLVKNASVRWSSEDSCIRSKLCNDVLTERLKQCQMLSIENNSELK